MIIYFGKVSLQRQEDLTFPKGLELLHVLGGQRAFSKHSATRPDLPFWWSLRLALSITRPPKLSVKEGLQAEGFGSYTPLDSFEVPKEAPFFYWALVVRASLAEGC